MLTFECREVPICAPCEHARCPGWKMKISSVCGACGHGACAECMLRGNEETGMVCCLCGKGGSILADIKGKEPLRDAKNA